MTIIDTAIESLDQHTIKITTIIDLRGPTFAGPDQPEIGEGPTRETVPDRIVHHLIEQAPGSVSLTELHDAVRGNPATVNRQAWTLAENAPDLAKRLRGWVVRVDRGRYALSPAARQHIGPPR